MQKDRKPRHRPRLSILPMKTCVSWEVSFPCDCFEARLQRVKICKTHNRKKKKEFLQFQKLQSQGSLKIKAREVSAKVQDTMLLNPGMYEGRACYDPNSKQGFAEESFSQHQSYQNFSMGEPMAIEAQFRVEVNMEMEQNNLILTSEQSRWDHLSCNKNCYDKLHHQGLNEDELQNEYNANSSQPNMPYPATLDLLNLFHLPNCSTTSLLPDSTFWSADPTCNLTHESSMATLMYDPVLPLNLPPEPPFSKELFQGYHLIGSGSESLFSVMETDRDGDGVFGFGKGLLRKERDGKDSKHYSTEKFRREQLNEWYQGLRKLLPNPTKIDRASIVGDAIDYINEQKRTVNELKLLVERKICSMDRMKWQRTEEDNLGSISTRLHADSDQANGSSLRSSWLQRKSKSTEVDIRIIEDDVTIKLVQQKRINSLFSVSEVLDELQLDLYHVAGGQIGDFYSFLLNAKICRGSTVYASAIMNKLIEVVDRQYAAISATGGY